jgi:hypothetical protein
VAEAKGEKVWAKAELKGTARFFVIRFTVLLSLQLDASPAEEVSNEFPEPFMKKLVLF